MKSLVTIIVPVYNTEEYLEQCLTSLLVQTYDNLQIILVDDGSTDASGKICDAFSEKDSRIQVIHQKNRGVSAARNAGLDCMTGEYLLFVDGDDSLVPDAVETAMGGFCDDQICVTVFGVTKVWKSEKRSQALPIETGVYTREEMLRGILKDYASFGAGFPVNKLWRVRDFGGVSQIPRFDEQLYFFEDLEWVVRMLMRVEKANLLSEYCYHYYIHPGSATHRPGAQERREMGYHQSIWKILEELSAEPAVKEWFSVRYYPEVVNGVINAWQHKRKKLQKLLLEKMNIIKWEVFTSKEIPLKIKFRCMVLNLMDRLRIL